MERRYAPYSKWFGTAYARLACAPTLSPRLRQVLLATSWREREEHLSAAYIYVAGLHNALGITPPLATEVAPYYERPYQVIGAARFAAALSAAIADPAVRALPFMIGAVDQWSDSTDVLSRPAAYRRLTALYRPG